MRSIEIGHKGWINVQKSIQVLQDPERVLLEVFEQKDSNLIAGERVKVPLQLRVIPADLHPVGVRSSPDRVSGEIERRLQPPASAPQIHLIIRVGPLDGMTQRADEE